MPSRSDRNSKKSLTIGLDRHWFAVDLGTPTRLKCFPNPELNWSVGDKFHREPPIAAGRIDDLAWSHQIDQGVGLKPRHPDGPEALAPGERGGEGESR